MDRAYQVLEAKYKNREVEFNSISKEMEKIRELEGQVRELSGLRGQGGSGGGISEYTPDVLKYMTPSESHNFPEVGENKEPSLLNELRRLKHSLQQYNAQFNEEIEEWARIPSINPIQKALCWYTSKFGRRKHPLTGKWHFHNGLDIAARRGSDISATAKGVITSITREDRYLGLTIKIRHNSTFSTVYGHLNQTVEGLKKGDKVSRHQIIGYVGSSGRTTGPHLHYEVHENGKAVNPKGFILDK